MGREQPHPQSLAVDSGLPQVRYERELTVGSVGTLWLGRLVTGNEAGRTVLLRRMAVDLFSTKDIDAFRQVAQAYSQVRHPSFVKLLGLVEQDRDLISVSEHLDGVRLSDLMRNCIDSDAPLPATVAVRIVLDAARATIKAHRLAAELGLFPVERLFVAEGVFIAAFGGTLLTEVGVLAAIARSQQIRNIPDLLAQLSPEELDQSGGAKGSPEVFSLGVILWEALANRCLFSRDSARQTLNDLRSMPIDPLDSIERCGMPVPDSLAELVRIATQRHPNQRYATLEQFIAAIEQLPAHFIATEHHVASALRSQAAELLKAIHVDPAQASLTLAFSEVPASRMSTRPPPENGHNWDPPTFNQSSLVAGAPRAFQIPKSKLDSDASSSAQSIADAKSSSSASAAAEPLVGAVPGSNAESSLGSGLAMHSRSLHGAVPVSSTAPDPPRHRSRNRRLKWLGGSVLLVVGLLAALHYVRTKSLTAIQPEGANVHVGSAPQSSATAMPVGAKASELDGLPAAKSIAPTLGAVPREEPRKVVPSSASSDPTSAETHVPSSLPKRSGATYRPQQIAPYRPKGI